MEAKIGLLENTFQVLQLQGGWSCIKRLAEGGNKTYIQEDMDKKG